MHRRARIRRGMSGLLCAGMLLCTQAWAGHVVRIKPEVFVQGPKVCVRDLAEIEAEGLEEIGDVEVGYAALPGQSKKIQAAFVESRLERAGFGGGIVDIQGAEISTVTTLHREITQEVVQESFQEFIAKNIPWDEDMAVVTLTVPKMTSIVPDGEVELVWRPSPTYDYVGVGTFQCEIQVDGVKRKSLLCRAMVDAYGHVVVAKTDLARGQRIGGKDVKLETRGLSTIPRGALTDIEEVVGLVAQRPIFANQVLTQRHAASRLVVKRRQIVRTEAREGALTVKSKAVALADARAGEMVVCETLDTKEEFVGIALETGVVLVQ